MSEQAIESLSNLTAAVDIDGKKAASRRKAVLVRPEYQHEVGFYTGLLATLGILIGVGSLLLLPLLVGAFSKQRTYIPTKIFDMLMLSFPWLVLAIGLIFALSMLAGIYYSHRIAGPLHKIESILRRRNGGEIIGMIKLRPKDQLHELSQLLNEMTSHDIHIEQSADQLLDALDEATKQAAIAEDNSITIADAPWQQLLQSRRVLKKALKRQTMQADKMPDKESASCD